MLISRTSPFCGVVTSREIPVTEEQLKAFEAGELIQVAMPNISADDREFILTGITPEEWDAVFGEGTEVDEQD